MKDNKIQKVQLTKNQQTKILDFFIRTSIPRMIQSEEIKSQQFYNS